MIKTELKRAFFSKGMIASLAVGIGIILWHQYSFVWNKELEIGSFYTIESLFYNWIGGSFYSMQAYLYYMILPILAVMPAGLSYYEDLHTGYYKNIYLRGMKNQYLYAKYIAQFLSAGFTVVLPLILSVYLTAMRFPIIKPETVMDLSPYMSSIGYTLYFEHPFLYIFLFLVIDFLFAGGFASICLVSTFFTEYRFAVLVTPFIIYYFLYALSNMVRENLVASPNYFLHPAYGINYWWEYVVGILFFLLCALFYVWRGKKYE